MLLRVVTLADPSSSLEATIHLFPKGAAWSAKRRAKSLSLEQEGASSAMHRLQVDQLGQFGHRRSEVTQSDWRESIHIGSVYLLHLPIGLSAQELLYINAHQWTILIDPCDFDAHSTCPSNTYVSTVSMMIH